MNLLTVAQVAQRLNLTRQGVQYLIDKKRIAAVWMLGRWAIPTEEVARLRKERKLRAA